MFRRKDKAGVKARYQFQFKYFDEDLYVGLVGIDAVNNTGKISNLVSIYMPYPSQVMKTVEENKVEVFEHGTTSQHIMIIAVCGSILLLGFFLFLGMLYYLKYKSKKTPASSPRLQDDLADTTSYSSDARNTSSHNLMPDVTHVTGMSPVFTAPPSSLPDSTPTYWSATQLLTEHEQRALAMSYGSCATQSASNREEDIEEPEEESIKYLDSESDYSDGITNHAFRHSNGTPVHGVVGSSDDIMDDDTSDICPEQEAPVRFSTTVQTIAPSTIATLRQNDLYIASARIRSVSLV
jgi:hypothetical protein